MPSHYPPGLNPYLYNWIYEETQIHILIYKFTNLYIFDFQVNNFMFFVRLKVICHIDEYIYKFLNLV